MKRVIALLVLLAVVGAGAFFITGVCCKKAATKYMQTSCAPGGFLYKELALSDKQKEIVGALESNFLKKKEPLCADMCGLRNEIAQVISQDTPDRKLLDEKVERLHNIQADLQKATIAHIFDIRAHLTAGQKARFSKLLQDEVSAGCERGACSAGGKCPMVSEKR